MIEAQWANDQHTTVYLALNGTWQSNEFAIAQQNLHTMLNEVGHSVSVIVHIVEPQPVSMEMVSQLHSLIEMENPNRDQMIIVAINGYLQGVEEVVRRTFNGHYPDYLHFTTDTNQAEQILAASN